MIHFILLICLLPQGSLLGGEVTITVAPRSIMQQDPLQEEALPPYSSSEIQINSHATAEQFYQRLINLRQAYQEQQHSLISLNPENTTSVKILLDTIGLKSSSEFTFRDKPQNLIFIKDIEKFSKKCSSIALPLLQRTLSYLTQQAPLDIVVKINQSSERCDVRINNIKESLSSCCNCFLSSCKCSLVSFCYYASCCECCNCGDGVECVLDGECPDMPACECSPLPAKSIYTTLSSPAQNITRIAQLLTTLNNKATLSTQEHLVKGALELRQTIDLAKITAQLTTLEAGLFTEIS